MLVFSYLFLDRLNQLHWFRYFLVNSRSRIDIKYSDSKELIPVISIREKSLSSFEPSLRTQFYEWVASVTKCLLNDKIVKEIVIFFQTNNDDSENNSFNGNTDSNDNGQKNFFPSNLSYKEVLFNS